MGLAFWLAKRIEQRKIERKLRELDEDNVEWLRDMKAMRDSPDVLRIGEFAKMDARNRGRRKS